MTVQILQGHVLDRLAELPEKSIHMVWTSPPYWGLRTYGTDPQAWPSGWTGEHGLEPSFDLWLAHEVEIFRTVRRVLRDDGTLWINIGDAYASSSNGRPADEIDKDNRTFRDKPFDTASGNFKPKDRILMPARLMIALHADGWWIRDEIVWGKANPMPSSVRDRTTPAHEMLYMLSKKARYFYDRIAISEPISDSSVARYAQATIDSQTGGAKQDAYEAGFTGQRARSRRPNEIIKDLASKSDYADVMRGGKNSRIRHDENGTPRPRKRKPAGWDTEPGTHSTVRHNGGERKEPTTGDNTWTTRNKRSVWHFALEPFDGAHFATAPTALVEPCIKAGTSEKGVCPHCAAPWVRNTDTSYSNPGNRATNGPRSVKNRNQTAGFPVRLEARRQTTGWSPSCSCPDNTPVPATILDPFGGAGTTGLVADALGRECILIELNPEYARLAASRIRNETEGIAKVRGIEHESGGDLPLFAAE